MNYAELTAALQEYLQTTETSFVSNIPTFIRQTEERINRAVIIPDLRKSDTLTTSTSNAQLAKPADYLSTFSVSVVDGSGDESFLILKDFSFLREAYPNATTEGLPQYYAHFDDGFWTLAPTPDSTYSVSLQYYYDPESIVTAGTSWLGDNAESVLLYGCLVEAYTYQKGDSDLLQLYQGRYDSALQDMIKLGLVRSKRDDYRGGEIRMAI